MVHTYSMNGINIAIDGNSGSVHILDNITYELLSCFNEPFTYEQAVEKLGDRYANDTIREVWEDINLLVEAGSLFSPEIDRYQY